MPEVMTLRSLTLPVLLALIAGCYSHGYHVRKAGHDHGEVAIDRNKPHSSVKWGTWWGVGTIWEPIGCVYADGSTHIVGGGTDDNCKSYYPLCEHGVGRLEVQPVFYTIPLSILSLGAFYAAEITAYCSTESGPDEATGPDEPSGPDEAVVGGEDSGPNARVPATPWNGAAHARAIR